MITIIATNGNLFRGIDITCENVKLSELKKVISESLNTFLMFNIKIGQLKKSQK